MSASAVPEPDSVRAVGERTALSRIIPILPVSDAELLGPGDDCAVVAAPDSRFVITTDMMIQGPDFRTAWSTPFELGWKAAVTNLSDVASMGARPTSLLVAIAAPDTTTVRYLEEISRGIAAACRELAPGCGVVGGDLSTSSVLTFAITAIGDLEGRPAVTRGGAVPGDVIAVAGTLGHAGAGIALLYEQGRSEANERGELIPNAELAQELRESHGQLISAQLAPYSPIGAGVEAALAGAHAMLDVSDGLFLDASRIEEASGVSFQFDEAALDAEAEVLHSLDSWVGDRARGFVESGGEDHALLATFPNDAVPPSFRVIGRVVETPASSTVRASAAAGSDVVTGWDPYRSWDGLAN